jgi:hypothetical protein
MTRTARSSQAADPFATTSSWKGNIAMARTSFASPTVYALAAMLLLGACAKEEHPLSPASTTPIPGPVHAGTFTGTYYYSSTFNWAGNYSHFDTTFQAIVQITAPEFDPEKRQVTFTGLAASYWPTSESPMTMTWVEADQRYQGSGSSMRFYGQGQDSVNFSLDIPGTTTQKAVRFHGGRQH